MHYCRQRDYQGALRSWADAANVIKRYGLDPQGSNILFRYKYSKDDEEIYKEFMEINNELIPHILKADGKRLSPDIC